MTINATAAWLLALYVDGRRGERRRARRAHGHDPERHHQGVPLARHLRLPARALDAADRRHGRLHRQRDPEAGTRSTSAATTCRRPARRRCRRSPTRSRPRSPCSTRSRPAARSPRRTSPRSSAGSRFFVNAGVRFIEEHAKLRAMGRALGVRSAASATASTEPKFLRLRYGVQVNSLGLTESQPENNVPRIVLEALAVTLGRDARARAIQLPAWNEALGLPRPWDQQWSLRIQQILANETDLLEYPDIFEGSKVMDGLVAELVEGAEAEMKAVEEQRRRGRGGPLHEGAPGRVAPRADRQDRARRDQGRRPELLHRDRGLAAHRRRRRRHPHPRPRGRARADRGARARGRPERDQAAVDAALERARRGRRATRRRTSCRRRSRPPRPAPPPASGPASCARSSATTARPTGVGGAAAGVGDGELLAGVREPGRRGLRGDRPPDPDPGRQARPRRPLQRRRADRRPRPRRRHGGDLPGHPPDARADRRLGASRRTSTWSASRSSPAPTASWSPRSCGCCASEGVDVPVVVGGIIPAADAARAARGRRRRRLHAQGLRPQPDHGRDRRPGRRAPPAPPA